MTPFRESRRAQFVVLLILGFLAIVAFVGPLHTLQV
jgi:hypothetical protein